jgi:integrase
MHVTLTDAKVRNLKEAGKHFDGGGLYLEVTKTGGRYWRLKYYFLRIERRLALGVYPTVSLKDARERREAAKKLLSQGIDPGEVKRASKEEAISAAKNTFSALAAQWLEVTASKRSEETQKKVKSWLQKDVLPQIGAIQIREVTARDILEKVIRRAEARGTIETALRLGQLCSQIMRFAVASGAAERDVSSALRGAAKTKETKHFAAITDPKKLVPLLRAIDAYQGHMTTVAALKLAPLVFVRPGELRTAEWIEIDCKERLWRIPGSKMKMKVDHIVPLSKQALKIIEALQPVTGGGKYLFPSIRTGERPMSENTVNAALKGMGFSAEEHTGHGFRATARTILDEVLDERVDLIEHQLAHMVTDSNKRAYNRTAHLPARMEMMQRWADYLDALRDQGA